MRWSGREMLMMTNSRALVETCGAHFFGKKSARRQEKSAASQITCQGKHCPHFCQYSSELYQICSSCVLCGYRMNFKISALHNLTMISQNSMLTNYAFTENLRLRKLHEIVLKFSAIGRNKYFGFLFKLLDNFLCIFLT